jgi:hypothetical protein
VYACAAGGLSAKPGLEMPAESRAARRALPACLLRKVLNIMSLPLCKVNGLLLDRKPELDYQASVSIRKFLL